MLRGCRCAIVSFLLAFPMAAADWPQFRGPGGQGVSDEKGLPVEWSATRNVAWKTAIDGRGHSSPVVWGDRVFVTTAIEGPKVPGVVPPKHVFHHRDYTHPDWVEPGSRWKLKLICLDARSGKILWERTAYDDVISDYRHRANTYASPSPVTDGRLVYAYFGTEGLYAFDMEGKPAWKASFGWVAQAGLGAGTSPVLYRDLIIVQCDIADGDESALIALDKTTGKPAWKAPRSTHATWSTPVIAQSGARTELIVTGAEYGAAYDPATGKELWRSPGVVSHAIPSVVSGQGIAVLSAGSQAKRSYAVRLGGAGDLAETDRILWRYDRGTAYVPSPILYGDYVYFMTDSGLLSCLELKTGEVKYQGRRVPVPAKFFASPVAYEGKIVLTSEDGDSFVIKAGPEHEVLGTNSLREPVHASPAISSGRIFIRTDEHLYCIRNGAGTP